MFLCSMYDIILKDSKLKHMSFTNGNKTYLTTYMSIVNDSVSYSTEISSLKRNKETT